MVNASCKLLRVGGWAPLLVFSIHAFLSRSVHAYTIWPPLDIPVHFCGGVAIAFFVSRCFQSLPRNTFQRSRVALLEILLIISLTATTAVFWEFGEFIYDQLFGSNVQISLANTMQDLAMGILGAAMVSIVRSVQLPVGRCELKEIAGDWVRGHAA